MFSIIRSQSSALFKAAALPAMFLLLSACAGGQNDLLTLPDDPNTEITNPDKASGPTPTPAPVQNPTPAPTSPSSEAAILERYQYLDPEQVIDTALLKTAVLYFEANQSKFANKNRITVIDFAKRSSEKRLFIVNMKDGSVWAMRTAHGKGSDSNGDGYAEQFSNISGSNASSLGFYRGAESYYGSNGLSLRMDGLSSTNSKARPRAIVIHGASYVREENVIAGRSWGCPAVAMSNYVEVVNTLKGGSLIYAGLSKK